MHITPTRISPGRSALTRPLTSWTDQANLSGHHHDDWPIENPHLLPRSVDPNLEPDDRQWDVIETNPAVSSAIAFRISTLVGKGWELEPGVGLGAEELFQFWSWWLEELNVADMLVNIMMSGPRGWSPVEHVARRRRWLDGPGSPEVLVPWKHNPVLSHQFRWTARKDLIYQPHGFVDSQLYRMDALACRMKWFTPAIGNLGNPYGQPTHGKWAYSDYLAQRFTDSGASQVDKAQGFLRAKRIITMPAGTKDPQLAKDVAALKESYKDLRAGGLWIEPPNWNVSWESLTSSVEAWVLLWEYHDNLASALYAGSPLATNTTGQAASRASSQSGIEVVRDNAHLDAEQANFEIRSGLFLPWSTANASLISKEFKVSGLRPQLGDVAMRSLPRIKFTALSRINRDSLSILAALKKLGVRSKGNPVRVDVAGTLRQANWNVVDPTEDPEAWIELEKEEPANPGLGQLGRRIAGPQGTLPGMERNRDTRAPDTRPPPTRDANGR